VRPNRGCGCSPACEGMKSAAYELVCSLAAGKLFPVWFVDVPVNETGAAFTKPVDRVAGESDQWLG
jgi:hypothetical protein